MASAVLHCTPRSRDLNTCLWTASLSLPGFVSTSEDSVYPDVDWPPSGYSIDVQCVLIFQIDNEDCVNYKTLLVIPSSITHIGLAHVLPRTPFQPLENTERF